MLSLAPNYKLPSLHFDKGYFYNKNYMDTSTSKQIPTSRINNINQITKFTNSSKIHPELHFMKDSPLPEIIDQIDKDEIKARIKINNNIN
jgi:hypothetical protein